MGSNVSLVKKDAAIDYCVSLDLNPYEKVWCLYQKHWTKVVRWELYVGNLNDSTVS